MDTIRSGSSAHGPRGAARRGEEQKHERANSSSPNRQRPCAPHFAGARHAAWSSCQAQRVGNRGEAVQSGRHLPGSDRPGEPGAIGLPGVAIMCRGDRRVVPSSSRRCCCPRATQEGNTPLAIAASRGHTEVVKYLIGQGANRRAVNDVSCQDLEANFFASRAGQGHASLRGDAAAMERRQATSPSTWPLGITWKLLSP